MLKLLEKGGEGNSLPFGIIVIWSYATGIITPYVIYRFKKTKALKSGKLKTRID